MVSFCMLKCAPVENMVLWPVCLCMCTVRCMQLEFVSIWRYEFLLWIETVCSGWRWLTNWNNSSHAYCPAWRTVTLHSLYSLRTHFSHCCWMLCLQCICHLIWMHETSPTIAVITKTWFITMITLSTIYINLDFKRPFVREKWIPEKKRFVIFYFVESI